MTHKHLLISIVVAGVGLLLVGFSSSSGQLPPPVGPTGRFQAIRVEPDPLRILILDTATGDLYAAGADDVKEYAKRPRLILPKLDRLRIEPAPIPEPVRRKPDGKIELQLTPEEIDRFIQEGDKK